MALSVVLVLMVLHHNRIRHRFMFVTLGFLVTCGFVCDVDVDGSTAAAGSEYSPKQIM